MNEKKESRGESDGRVHALDAVRAFALLLGVVFHASESFWPAARYYWAICDNSTSKLLELCRHTSHSFRLELFFLIAGFFAHLVWTKRGVGGFLRNRALRILVPLVAGWLILYPVLVFLWMTGVAKSGRWDLFGIPSEFRSLPPWQLTLGLFVSLEFLKKFDLTHLWFLHQLLVLYVAALAVRWCALHSQHGPAIVKGLDACFRKLLSSRLKVLWLALLVFPALYLQHEWGVDTPKQSLIPELPATSLFAIFFATGWAIHRQAALLEVTGRFWGWHLAIGILITAPSAYMLSVAAGLGWLKTHWVLVRVVFCLVYGLMMWGFVLGCLGWFLHCRRTESRAWRYIADSSYWVYLAHLPVIVALQIWVAFWPQSWILKFPLILLIAIPLLFASYHFLVRPTFIGLLLNGRRYPLRPAPQAEPKPSALLPT